jgi:hypothetical protein
MFTGNFGCSQSLSGVDGAKLPRSGTWISMSETKHIWASPQASISYLITELTSTMVSSDKANIKISFKYILRDASFNDRITFLIKNYIRELTFTLLDISQFKNLLFYATIWVHT